MYAYEVARQLTDQGQRVHGLLLIESACPRPLLGLPEITVELLDETGAFDGIPIRPGRAEADTMTMNQKRHVAGCCRSVSGYNPIPLKPHQRPVKSYVIWSRYGLFEKLALKIKEVGEYIAEQRGLEKIGINKDWLTEERSSFGPKGWDRLLGDPECFSVDGDHFSIMMLPKVIFSVANHDFKINIAWTKADINRSKQ